MHEELSTLDGLAFHSTSTYKMLEEIGRGGMGIVYLAEKHCEGVDDLVVLKTIKTLSPQHIEMLRKEANIATHLRHENIVKTYGLEAIPSGSLPKQFRSELKDLQYEKVKRRPKPKRRGRRLQAHSKRAGKLVTKTADDGQKLYLITMDYVEGTDLGSLFRDHRRANLLIPPIFTGFIISRICRALDYAHESIIHRDISPENIMIDKQGVSKLTDFGVAVGGNEQMDLLVGKLGYMSPEQINREQYNNQIDIFALGVVAYQMLTGINLFGTPARLNLQEQIEYIKGLHTRPIIPPARIMTDVPVLLSEIVMKMLKVDREQRYKKAISACNDLEQKYMYAKGFGPTNNSLKAYIEIFDKQFKEYDQEQLKQLRFLKGDDGKVHLQRTIQSHRYTPEGLQFIRKFPGTRLYELLIT